MYDRAGKITEIADPAGVTTHYEYDILGRTSRIFSTEGMEVRYRYDCLDRLEQIHYGNGSTRREIRKPSGMTKKATCPCTSTGTGGGYPARITYSET